MSSYYNTDRIQKFCKLLLKLLQYTIKRKVVWKIALNVHIGLEFQLCGFINMNSSICKCHTEMVFYSSSVLYRRYAQ